MGLSNKEYYKHTMDKYKRTANRLIRTVDNLSNEIEKYEKEQLQILSDIEEFSDAISLIQNRPQFSNIEIEHIKLPEINMEDLKIESKESKKLFAKYKGPEIGVSNLLVTPEIESYGILGHDIPLLEGSILGTQTKMFLDKLVGSEFAQFVGRNESNRIYELSRVIDDIEKNVNNTVPKLECIKRVTNDLYNSIKNARKVYETEFTVVKEATKRTCNYSEFQKFEQVALKNTVMLIGMLYQMCKVKLMKKTNVQAEDVEINEEIRIINDNSNILVAQVKHNYEEARCLKETSIDIIDDGVGSEEKNTKVITMDIADKVNIHRNYVILDSCIAYLDEEAKEVKAIDYEMLNTVTLNINVKLDNLSYINFGGINDEIYFVLAEDGVNKFYEYDVRNKRLSCIYSCVKQTICDEYHHLQCNEHYIVYASQKGMYASDGYELNIFDISNKEMKKYEVLNINGFVLEQDSIFINRDGIVYRYSIEEQCETKIGKMNDYSMMSFMYTSEERNVKIEGERLYTWTMSRDADDKGIIDVVELNLETGKSKKYHIIDSCEMVGMYNDGYVYYIRCDSKDSLCRYNLMTKKKEILVEQTDCAISCVSGFLKKKTSYLVRKEDVGLQIIDNYLYYYSGMRNINNGRTMRVELNNDFLLSEIE